MSEIAKSELCPKCKGSKCSNYERNELGNLEALPCSRCKGVGWLSSESILPNQPDNTPRTHTYTNTAKPPTLAEAEELLKTIHVDLGEKDISRYFLLDISSGSIKIIEVKDNYFLTDLLDHLFGKKSFISPDPSIIKIKGEMSC
jgi:hypothetical protein